MKRGGGYGAAPPPPNSPARRPATPAAARPRYFLEDLNSGDPPLLIGEDPSQWIELRVNGVVAWLIQPSVAFLQDGGGVTLVIRRQDMTDMEVAALKAEI
jgi:hypothetical protein